MFTVTSKDIGNGRVEFVVDGFTPWDYEPEVKPSSGICPCFVKQIQVAALLQSVCRGVGAVAHVATLAGPLGEMPPSPHWDWIPVGGGSGNFSRRSPKGHSVLLPFETLIQSALDVYELIWNAGLTVYVSAEGSAAKLQQQLADEARAIAPTWPEPQQTGRPDIKYMLSCERTKEWLNCVYSIARDVMWVGHDGCSVCLQLGRPDAVEVVKEALFRVVDLENMAVQRYGDLRPVIEQPEDLGGIWAELLQLS